ncbi:MAG TPA: TIGR03557 family F420-dependent LLM class oxidoreductase [Streptosporangiaceae bacterium]|nr:TIGR03557 family F420-dependent LLM class oxidoreductase [Streptosporangiaceae bacterium]
MTRFGYFLSSEEHDPREIVRQARLAEQAGFDGLWISDHFHPWLDEQGQSGFVWSMIGAISQACSLPVTTAVTCPLSRVHPAVVAQAAATSALLTGGRFTLGVGTGEALNEHIVGGPWPPTEERLEMLDEAVHVIRELMTGKLISHQGEHYTVQTARLYSVPGDPPPIYMSGYGEKSARLAGRIADGYINTRPDADLVRLYRESGGGDRPVQGGMKVCWGPDEAAARATVHRLWPTDEIPGESAQLLPSPRHFRQLSALISEEMISAACGPDPEVHAARVLAYTSAGFDEVYVSQVGPDVEGFFDFYGSTVLPRLREATA